MFCGGDSALESIIGKVHFCVSLYVQYGRAVDQIMIIQIGRPSLSSGYMNNNSSSNKHLK